MNKTLTTEKMKTKVVQPQRTYLIICKIANALVADGGPLTDELDCITIPKKDVGVTVNMAIEDSEDPNLRITRYDMAVMDAVYTLYMHNCTAFTLSTVVRTMTGDPEKDVTVHMTEAVNGSIKKLAAITITLDCTAEFYVRKKIDKGETKVLRGRLLPATEINVLQANHREVKSGYQLTEKLVLYQYAEAVGQIISVPSERFRVAGVSDTQEAIIIRRYLVRRIEGMRHGRNNLYANRIAYNWYDAKKAAYKGLLPALGYSEDTTDHWRGKKAKVHRTVLAILDAYVADGYIRGYEILRDSPYNGISGVAIKL